MPFAPRQPPLTRRADGAIVVGLGNPEREVLHHLLGQLRVMVRSPAAGEEIDGNSPVRRLFPTAYTTDADREEEYQEMVRGSLVEQRLSGIDAVEQTLSADTIDDEHADIWMRTLNDLRLVIGTRLDVSEDQTEVDDDDPDLQLHAVYDYLGFLVDRLVSTLTESLPDDPTPRP